METIATVSNDTMSLPDSDQVTHGGYDYKIVGTTESDYICSICTKVLRDAHLTGCCGQHFCASCLTHWLGTQQGKKTCPHCRQEDFQHIVNKAIIHKVNELKICCTNHREGCGWVGELGGLMSHLDSDKGCGYVEVTCTNKGCGERVSRKDLQTHLQEKCYYRPYECEHCGHKDTHKAITSLHYSECLEYPLACPNRCGVTGIRRRAMPDHRSSCPLEFLNCSNKWRGCRERIRRKNLHTHLQEKCYYRPYECEHCGHKDTYQAITGRQDMRTLQSSQRNLLPATNHGSHYSECPEYLLACPNRCGVTGIRRRAMPDHHSSCPLEPLDCPFKDAGCTEKIAHKDMEDHMTANQQKHMLLTFQSLQQANQQVKQDLSDTKRELYDTKQELHDIKQDYHNLLQSANGLCKVGDTLTFGVRDFPKLRKEMKVWHSPPFSIGDKVRVCLAVYPNGVGRGRWSHVSVSLILMEVVQKEEEMYLQYNVSVAAIGQHRLATLELCTIRWGDNSIFGTFQDTRCCANFPFPSPGEVLQSEELFLEIEEASSLLQNDAMTLELKLLKHQHHLQ